MSFDMEPDHDEHGECRHEIKRLQAKVERLRAVLTTPEVYADVISDAMESELAEVMSQNKRLQAIVDALPMCWRLKDGELVQDVPVVPGMRIYHLEDGEVDELDVKDCYDSPEALEHAAKAAKGATCRRTPNA